MAEHPTHLVVVLHGLMGFPGNVEYLAQQLRVALGKKGVVLVPDCNSYFQSLDGIDAGGQRAYYEIRRALSDNPTITEFSIIGYSLGGLYSRYVIGIMLEQGVFEKITPMNFATFATPHLGSRSSPDTYFEGFWNWVVRKTTSITGTQLLMEDRTIGNYPLLFGMSLKGSSFYQALVSFQNISLYANVQADRTVPYETSAIAFTNPFSSRYSTLVNPPNPQKYPHVISVQFGAKKGASDTQSSALKTISVTSRTAHIAFTPSHGDSASSRTQGPYQAQASEYAPQDDFRVICTHLIHGQFHLHFYSSTCNPPRLLVEQDGRKKDLPFCTLFSLISTITKFRFLCIILPSNLSKISFGLDSFRFLKVCKLMPSPNQIYIGNDNHYGEQFERTVLEEG